MKTKLVVTAVLLIAAVNVIYGQSIVHPWKVVDNGGGKSTAGGITLHASIGQPAVQPMAGTGLSLESGYVPAVRILSGATAFALIAVGSGWNLVSVPLTVSDYRKSVLFPAAVSPAFYFHNGYQQRDTLRKGEGYWLKFDTTRSVGMSGTSITEDTINVNAGWNIVGAISYRILGASVTAVPPISILSSFYGFAAGTGYSAPDTLKPGSGYWVKVSGAGSIVMRSGSVLVKSLAGKEDGLGAAEGVLDEQAGLNKLVLKDAEGRERTLYFSSARSDLDVERFELPPPPPEGVMDVRFASQRSLEVAKAADGRPEEFPIRISGVKYPLELKWDAGADQGESILEVTYAGEESQRYRLSNEGSIVLMKPNVLSVKLLMTAKRTAELPKEFALHQNYPNPFNPSTSIRYQLPVESKVKLTIYNLLGQEVKTVVDEIQSASYHSIEWDAKNYDGQAVASGVYFYRLDAASTKDATIGFNSVMKMILMR